MFHKDGFCYGYSSLFSVVPNSIFHVEALCYNNYNTLTSSSA